MEKRREYQGKKKMDIRSMEIDGDNDGMEMQDHMESLEKETLEEEDSIKKGNIQNVILQIENQDDELEEIDLVNVAEYMRKKWKQYVYLLVIMICIGFAVAILTTGVQNLFKKGSASAVVTFNFDGLDEGLNPNGGVFDVSEMKSTVVVNDALENLGWERQDVEEIRANLKIEGVIPESVKQKIAIINTVAEDAAEYYANIEDINYFPSQYTVTLQRCSGMSGDETRELLDAILLAYRDYFMGSYADTSVIGLASSVLDIETYDYLQASDILENEIETMQSYVDAKADEAPEFRASSTGLSFGDLSNSIGALKRLDLNNFISFVQANNLTKDAGVQVDYYNYQIEQYTFEIQELQTMLSNVEKTIAAYEKDPVIVMSSQESVTETTQTNEYYDTLLAQKLELSTEISKRNTELNEAYAMINALNASQQSGREEDYAYADTQLEGLVKTMEGWSELVQKTTEEYFEAYLYADAYRVSIPAQYSALGSIGDLIKRMAIFGAVAAGIVIILWGFAGLKEEIRRSREMK